MEECAQQIEGGDSHPLFCSGETSPEVLCPAIGTPTKEDGDLLEQVFTEAFQDLKRDMRELERGFSQCHVVTEQWGMALKRKTADLDNRKKKSSQ